MRKEELVSCVQLYNRTPSILSVMIWVARKFSRDTSEMENPSAITPKTPAKATRTTAVATATSIKLKADCSARVPGWFGLLVVIFVHRPSELSIRVFTDGLRSSRSKPVMHQQLSD